MVREAEDTASIFTNYVGFMRAGVGKFEQAEVFYGERSLFG
jgi:hypothetical protein